MIEDISRHFASYHEPVVGCGRDEILFMNSAAEGIFAGRADTLRPPDCFPVEVLENDGENALAAFGLRGKQVTVSISRIGDIKIFRVVSQDGDPQRGDKSFLANISGQMRESLSVLNMSSGLLMAGIENLGQPNLIEHMSMIYHSYFKLLRLSGNIVSYNRLSGSTSDFKPRNTDVIELCGELVSSVRYFTSGRGIRLRFESETNRLIMAVDVPKFEKMLLNLLSNSLKYTPSGGEVTVSAHVKGQNLTLSVCDTGRGIPPELLTTSFDKYAFEKDYSDAPGGVGLGFALVRHIAELHGGTLLLESVMDKGSAVTISIPIGQAEADEFREELTNYRQKSMNMIYTELSDVLSHRDYIHMLMD